MGISDYKTADDDSTGSKTYIEMRSDGTEAEQEAYHLLRRGGRIREGVEDVDELYANLSIHLADVLFEDDASGLLEFLEVDEDDWQQYQES